VQPGTNKRSNADMMFTLWYGALFELHYGGLDVLTPRTENAPMNARPDCSASSSCSVSTPAGLKTHR
jgi:hypothetical protein